MNIVLGITGGIAAYKAPDLVRRLREAWCGRADRHDRVGRGVRHGNRAAGRVRASDSLQPVGQGSRGRDEPHRARALGRRRADRAGDSRSHGAHRQRRGTGSADDDLPRNRGADCSGAGDESRHVEQSGDAGESRAAGAARHSYSRARNGLAGLWRNRSRPNAGAARHRCHGLQPGLGKGSWPTCRAQGHRHGGPDPRGDRPGALPDESQLRKDGLRDRTRRGGSRARTSY